MPRNLYLKFSRFNKLLLLFLIYPLYIFVSRYFRLIYLNPRFSPAVIFRIFLKSGNISARISSF